MKNRLLFLSRNLATLLGLIFFAGFCEQKAFSQVKITVDLAKAIIKYDGCGGFSEGMAVVWKDEKHGYIDKNGKEIVPCVYDNAEDFNCERAIVKLGDNVGVIDKKGNIVIPFYYKEISDFEDGLAIARQHKSSSSIDCEEYGVIDINGKVIIPFNYCYIGYFSEGVALVRNKNGEDGWIDITGKMVIPFGKYRSGGDFFSAYFRNGLTRIVHNNQIGYINKKGEIVIPPKYYPAYITEDFRDGYAIVGIGSEIGTNNVHPVIIDTLGRIKAKLMDGFDYRVFWQGKYIMAKNPYQHVCGVLNPVGEIVIPFDFEYILQRVTDGMVMVRNHDMKVGFWDLAKGKLTIPCEYEYKPIASFLSEGVICVYKNGKCGYLDKNNNIVIPFRYDSGSNFYEGVAVVKKNGTPGFVDKQGNDTFKLLGL